MARPVATAYSRNTPKARSARRIRCARQAFRTGPTTRACASRCRWCQSLTLPSYEVPTAPDELTRIRQIGWVELPDPVGERLAVWWLEQYGGGLFVPFRDATAGSSTYGAGRYLLDTAKGADLGIGR